MTSGDDRIGATVVEIIEGHMHNPTRLIATFSEDAPIEHDFANLTTFDLGKVNYLEPPLRLDKLNDRLYRLSYSASVSDTFENALLCFSHDLHLAEDGALTRVVPVQAFSSFWDMDGSKMGLIVSGPHRSIFYVDPKAGSTMTPGTLFSMARRMEKPTAGRFSIGAGNGAADRLLLASMISRRLPKARSRTTARPSSSRLSLRSGKMDRMFPSAPSKPIRSVSRRLVIPRSGNC